MQVIEPQSPFIRRSSALLIVCPIFAVTAVFGLIAEHHGINPDEGFYLAAGSAVGSGLKPYVDFFFPQMPYLPYLEAAFMAVYGIGLHAGRHISVGSTAMLAGVLAVRSAEHARRAEVGVAVALLYATHVLSLNYLTVLKTYGIANLLIVSALLLVVREKSSLGRLALAGLLAALAVGVRLPMLAVLAVLCLWCARADWKRGAVFAAGALPALLPVALLAISDPQAFWFNNVGFHDLRREIVGVGPILAQKAGVLARWVLVPQNLILWCLAIVGWLRGSRRESCALLAAVALGAMYLYATPTYLEYMVQLMPLLLIAGTPAIALLLERRSMAFAVATIWFIGLAVALRPAGAGSERAEKLELWSRTTVDSVARHLQDNSEPTDTVLSWWEGYPILAMRPGYKEVGFWQSNAAKKLSTEDRQRYHVAATDDVRKIIESGAPRLIVAADDEWVDLRPAIARRYRLSQTFGPVQVFIRQPSTGGSDG